MLCCVVVLSCLAQLLHGLNLSVTFCCVISRCVANALLSRSTAFTNPFRHHYYITYTKPEPNQALLTSHSRAEVAASTPTAQNVSTMSCQLLHSSQHPAAAFVTSAPRGNQQQLNPCCQRRRQLLVVKAGGFVSRACIDHTSPLAAQMQHNKHARLCCLYHPCLPTTHHTNTRSCSWPHAHQPQQRRGCQTHRHVLQQQEATGQRGNPRPPACGVGGAHRL